MKNAFIRRIKVQLDRLRLRAFLKAIMGNKEVSIISSNCIGGRLYQLLDQEYRSPTIGLWFRYDDFCKFSIDIDFYIQQTPTEDHALSEIYGYPVGDICGVKLMFQHYKSFEEASSKWVRRARRINSNNILVICTDRDGFDLSEYAKFSLIKHEKIFLTAKNDIANEDVAIVSAYKGEEFVGDIYSNYETLNSKPVRVAIKTRIDSITTKTQ